MLALEDGTCFRGVAVGASGETAGEVVFNTSMTGYQEVLTDPSYAGQIVTMTCPEIGNYGVTPEDAESRGAAGRRVRRPPGVARRQQLAGAADTSGIPRRARHRGDRRHRHARPHAPAPVGGRDARGAWRRARRLRGDLVERRVGCRRWRARTWCGGVTCGRAVRVAGRRDGPDGATARPDGLPDSCLTRGAAGRRLRVAAYDFGMKWNILRRLAAHGVRRPRVPGLGAGQSELLASGARRCLPEQRAGRSGGRRLRHRERARARSASGVPMFGICLGHQILALALGAPDLQAEVRPPRREPSGQEPRDGRRRDHLAEPRLRGRPGPLPADVRLTHVSLYDGTVEGFRHRDAPDLLRAVPPGGVARAPRRRLPVRVVCRRDGATPVMPLRTDIQRVLVIGSGPIVIGQACEFDYSGTQACKALRAEGLEVVLVNSNPATIMTDPEMADRTYVEPLTPEVLAAIIERERPDALLPTVGGQTALNLAVALAENGMLERHGVELIGASLEAIKVAEDRLAFREAMRSIGIDVPESGLARTLDEALALVEPRRLPRDHPPVVHAGRRRGGHCLQHRGVPRPGRARPEPEPGPRGPDRGVGPRLEGIRARGDARRRGQLRRRLLDREHRPDGDPHRRQHHGRAGADADRQGIPAAARRGRAGSSAASASRRAGRTSSSPSTPPTGAWWRSR